MKLTISTNTAKVLAKALPLALERAGSQRVHLTYIEIANIEGTLTFTATNGYVAFRIGVDSHGELPDTPIYAMGKELCKALTDTAKAAGKYTPTISLEYGWHKGLNRHTVTVSADTALTDVQCDDIYFPPLDTILAANHDSETGVLLNGSFLADIAKAATLCAGDSGLVTVETLNTRKAGKITAYSSGIQFVGLIMPCRQESKVIR